MQKIMQRKQLKNKTQKHALVIMLLLLVFLIPKNVQATQDVTNRFKDENLKNAIIEIIQKVTGDASKKTITTEDIETITSDELPSGKQLNLANKNIQDLSGLELFADKKIEWIYLDWNNIEDISVLSNFTELTKISASGNQIINLSPIQNLTKLQNINFSNNNIEHLNYLMNLSGLKYCYLDNNKITDITALTSLTQLEELSISGNNIQNIAPASTIEKLVNLDVSRNNIDTISNIQTNQSIKKINLNYNKLKNLNGIEKLTNLEILTASNNTIEDIEGIGQISKLNNLNLNKNSISNISCLSNCSQLEYLYLDSNKIIDITSIEQLNNLKKITVYNQTHDLIIDEDYGNQDVKLTLTNLFTNLRNPQSKIYVETLQCKTNGVAEVAIAEDFSYLVVNFNAIKEKELVLTIQDDDYTYVTLNIKVQLKVEEENNEIDLNGTEYNLEENYIKNIKNNTTAQQFISKLKNDKAYIQRAENIFVGDTVICNGDTLKFEDKSYTLIVEADPSGDGITTIADLMQVQNHVLGRQLLDGIAYKAADINNDNQINIVDVMNIINIILRNVI